MKIEIIKRVLTYCNMYTLLKSLKNNNEINNIYINHIKNYYDELKVFKELNIETNIKINSNFDYKKYIKKNRKFLILSLSTYYQNYFFYLKGLNNYKIYSLFLENNFIKNNLNYIKNNFSNLYCKSNNLILFGIKGIRKFIKHKNIKFLKLNFDGGYFNNYFVVPIDRNISLKFSKNIFRLSKLSGSNIILSFFAKDSENNINLFLYSFINLEEINKMKIVKKLFQNFILFFLNNYPEQWLRWSSINFQFHKNEHNIKNKIINTKNILILKYNNHFFLYHIYNRKLYEINNECIKKYKNLIEGNFYDITC